MSHKDSPHKIRLFIWPIFYTPVILSYIEDYLMAEQRNWDNEYIWQKDRRYKIHDRMVVSQLSLGYNVFALMLNISPSELTTFIILMMLV